MSALGAPARTKRTAAITTSSTAMRDALPHASFIGFTGTPIELRDVFGDNVVAAKAHLGGAQVKPARQAAGGKAMVVVMSRRIAIDLYCALVALRPAWHGEDDEHGTLKLAVTGSASDALDWQPHIRNKPRRGCWPAASGTRPLRKGTTADPSRIHRIHRRLTSE